MSAAWIVFRKELVDNLRDRRTVLSAFSLALIGPVAFVALMSFVLNTALGKSDEPLPLAVIGEEWAPQFIEYLRSQNTELTFPDLADPEQAVTDGAESLVLVIPEDYGPAFQSGDPAALALIYDSSDFGSARSRFSRARTLINQYGRKIGVLRLQLRGIDPTIATPLFVQEVDTASPAARALTLLATLPYLLVFVVFMGGFYLAIDTTAGEREHGSLEPLLTQPVRRTELVIGKLSATCLFALVSLILFLIGFALAVPFVPFHKVGMSLDVDLLKCLAIIGVSLPLILFGAALLTLVASFARSYKEAQTYLSFVVLVPTLPLIVTQLMNLDRTWWLMLIPSVSQATLISDLLVSDPVPGAFIALSIGGTAAAAFVLAWLAIRLYQRESILGD